MMQATFNCRLMVMSLLRFDLAGVVDSARKHCAATRQIDGMPLPRICAEGV
jgi:hypothetical protein